MVRVRSYVRRHRGIRFACPIKRGDAPAPKFVIYGMKTEGGEIPIPDDLKRRLLAAKGPIEIERLIAEAEPQLAAMDNREFLDCDEAANLMAATLREKGIAHIAVIGESDEGSSHAYIIVKGRRFDPTKQGYGSGEIEEATKWP